MIQIYKKDNTNFEKNGDYVLTPSLAEVHAELNGTWSANIEHPIDRLGRWELIEEETVIKMPSFNGEQLFRIKSRVRTDSKVTAEAEPIFMDAMDDCFLVDVRPTDKNGQQALDLMTASNKKYNAKSNIAAKSTAYYDHKNLIEAINGEDENAFTKRWGGEILFDNFTVTVNDRIGADHGVEIRYGKNMPVDGVSESVDVREVVTRIYPKGYNGVTMSGKGYVDSPNIAAFPNVKTAVITFDDVKMAADAQEDDAENGITVCDTQAQLDAALKKKCEEQYAEGIDKPKVSITINMVLLTGTVQYSEYSALEAVSLGDSIHCISNRLKIDTTARVIGLTYDAAGQKVKSVEIGEATYNYFNNVSSVLQRTEAAIRPDGTVIGSQVQGFIDAAKASLRALRNVAEKQEWRAIITEDLDPNSPTFGAMVIGTSGFQISNKRNADNTDWIWTTFGTGAGFNADLITAGTIAGDRIHGGTITVGGSGNANGKIIVTDGSGNTMVNMDRLGVTLANGASIISANGVCGNLQYISGGGQPEMLGYKNNGGATGKASVLLSAYIPEKYVIQSAKLVLKLCPASWYDQIADKTYTGYARQVELKYGSDAALSFAGIIPGEFVPVETGFSAVPDAYLGGFSGKPSGSASAVKTITSGELKSLLSAGKMTVFEIASYAPTSTAQSSYAYTGAALAVLNVIGYTQT